MTSRRTRDYRHFPPEYDNLLCKFVTDGGTTLSFPLERDARHTARELYRYREALQNAADSEPENEHVRNMCTIFRDVIVRCFADGATFHSDEHGGKTGSAGAWIVSLELNPIVAAMRAVAVAGPPTDA